MITFYVGKIPKSRLIFFAAPVIGAIGAFGQSYLLHHELVYSYPYKIMSFPPAEFYAGIGKSGFYLAPVIAVICGLLFGLKRFWPMIIVPPTLCPLLFAGVFKTASIMLVWTGLTNTDRNFDEITPAKATQVQYCWQLPV